MTLVEVTPPRVTVRSTVPAASVVEVAETAEEAVVSKTARVKEEVVIHKEAAERTETIRDTVRREDVEITKEPGTEPATGTTSAVPAGASPKI